MAVLPRFSKNTVFAFEVTEANFAHFRLLVQNPPGIEHKRWANRTNTKYSEDYPNVSLHSRT